MNASIRHRLAVLPIAALVLTAAACGGKNADTDCSTSACVVTFDRGVDAHASVLGIKAELVDVNGDRATLKVAGQTVTLPVGSNAKAGGMSITINDINKKHVVVKISQSGEG